MSEQTRQAFEMALAKLSGKPILLDDDDLEVLYSAGRGLGQLAEEARTAARAKATTTTPRPVSRVDSLKQTISRWRKPR